MQRFTTMLHEAYWLHFLFPQDFLVGLLENCMRDFTITAHSPKTKTSMLVDRVKPTCSLDSCQSFNSAEYPARLPSPDKMRFLGIESHSHITSFKWRRVCEYVLYCVCIPGYSMTLQGNWILWMCDDNIVDIRHDLVNLKLNIVCNYKPARICSGFNERLSRLMFLLRLEA